MIVPFAHFMLKDVTIKGSVVYDGKDFAEVMQMVGEGKPSINHFSIELTTFRQVSGSRKYGDGKDWT